MGGKTATTTQQVKIPPEVMARYNAVNARAEEAAKQPFQAYTGQFVAGLTPTQQAGIEAVSRATNLAQPYYDTAKGLALSGAKDVGPLTQEQIAYYQNPYTQAVAAPTLEALRQQQGREAAQQQALAIRSGAAFGDRSGIERAMLSRQQALGTAQAIAPIYSQGYQQAVQTAAGQQGVAAQDLARRLQAAQSVAGLGTGLQAAALQGAQAQIGAGTLEQQTQQADLTARYQQFLQERGYPFQVAQFLANIAMGTGALSGSTTTTTQPAGFFSDKRLKEDAVRIGQTDEGVPIYSYRYKGQEGPKQIGLMAQDVEKVHPEAVGLAAAADGRYYKTVNYEKATERPRKEYGGGLDLAGADQNWMGGAVQPDSEGMEYSRGGYAPGGLVSPVDLQAILASQRESFGPFGQSGFYGGKGPGGGAPGLGGIVPEAKLPVPKLMTASGMPRAPQSGFEQAAQTGKNISDLYNLGKAGLVGSEATKDRPKGTAGIVGAAGKFSSEDNAFKRFQDLLAGKAYGGATGYAAGGEIDPYDLSADPLSDVIKAGKAEIRELPKPGQPPGAPKSGLGEALDLAKGAASLYSLGSTAIPAAAEGLTALAALLPFSDERMKKDVKPVGETYDGQTIYRYNLGDGITQIGLMAQESRKDAVHKDGLGILHLDYKKATENAVPFAYGGLVPRQGYQVGGEIENYSPEADPPAIGAQEVQRQENPLASSIRRTAEEVGIDPVDLATAISYETGGTFDPWKRGPTTKWGEHRGLIQWGEPQRAQYGVTRESTPEQQMAAVGQYLRDRGVKPGMGLLDVYSAINAGRVGLYDRTDEPAGGAPGTVADKVANMGAHRERAARMLGINPEDLPAAGARDVQGGGKAPLGEAARGVPGQYAGVPAGKASVGDVAREYLPKGIPTSEKFWVPALGFLGSMLASKSPFLGQAIGEGLVGGVSAYTGLEKERSEIEKRKAEEEKLRTEAKVQEATQLYERRWITGRGWFVIDKSKPFAAPIQITDAKLNPIPGVDPMVGRIPISSESKDAPGADKNPGAAPPSRETSQGAAPAPSAPATTTELPRESTPFAQDVTKWQATVRAPLDYEPPNQMNIEMSRSENPSLANIQVDRAKKFVEDQSRKGEAAFTQLTQLERMDKAIEALPSEGFTAPGAFAAQRKAFAEKVNDVVNVIGGRPMFDPRDIALLEEVSKDTFRLGAALANSIGTREPGFIVQQSVQANPGITNTKQGYRLIASGLREAARYEQDKATFYDDYVGRFGHLDGAEELFRRLNPPTNYARRALANTANPEQAAALRQYLSQEGVTAGQKREAIERFDKFNGKGVANAILGLP